MVIRYMTMDDLDAMGIKWKADDAGTLALAERIGIHPEADARLAAATGAAPSRMRVTGSTAHVDDAGKVYRMDASVTNGPTFALVGTLAEIEARLRSGFVGVDVDTGETGKASDWPMVAKRMREECARAKAHEPRAATGAGPCVAVSAGPSVDVERGAPSLLAAPTQGRIKSVSVVGPDGAETHLPDGTTIRPVDAADREARRLGTHAGERAMAAAVVNKANAAARDAFSSPGKWDWSGNGREEIAMREQRPSYITIKRMGEAERDGLTLRPAGEIAELVGAKMTTPAPAQTQAVLDEVKAWKERAALAALRAEIDRLIADDSGPFAHARAGALRCYGEPRSAQGPKDARSLHAALLRYEEARGGARASAAAAQREADLIEPHALAVYERERSRCTVHGRRP